MLRQSVVVISMAIMCLDDREPHFDSFLERLRTFSNWPRVQTPDALASVGFFRIKGSVDEVQCFYCGVRIFDWEPHDDPLSEHLRWSKKCRFANLVNNMQTLDEFIQKSFKLIETLIDVDVADNNREGVADNNRERVAGNNSEGVAKNPQCFCCSRRR